MDSKRHQSTPRILKKCKRSRSITHKVVSKQIVLKPIPQNKVEAFCPPVEPKEEEKHPMYKEAPIDLEEQNEDCHHIGYHFRKYYKVNSIFNL